MQMREAAERILFAETLEEKLLLAPAVASDDAPGSAILTPFSPGRPDELRICAKGVRVEFPGIHRLDDDRERGTMLHFLANHELLASELMALVLLKFPDAPKEYRAGVYAAMREEQMHTLMYVRRMKECGIAFGELPLNDYFWRLIAPMETPMDFVTRLNLTFEQANLDFSKHYAGLFREVGDTSTAAVLEKIYQDEIGHVGHGLKWFRRWKDQGSTDWQAFGKSLTFPLAPAKAKGLAPFNAEGRRLAGLDEDFIRHLEVCEQSRGRTPVVHWFNPGAEDQVMASVSGKPFQANKMGLALEEDLELLMIAVCRRDDVLLMRRPPSNEHLAYLKRIGFDLPEITSVEALGDRKLGGLRPWAWSPDASQLLKPLASEVSPNVPWQWRAPLPSLWFSKEIGIELEKRLGFEHESGTVYREVDHAMQEIARHLESGQALIKAVHACAGRGHLRVNPESKEADTRLWLERTLAAHHAVVVEPWLERVADFSALYEMDAAGTVNPVGLTVMENDAAGRFLGSRVGPKWGSLLDPEIAAFLFKQGILDFVETLAPAALSTLLPNYSGPLGIDMMVHRLADGGLALKHVVELNVRLTMGRIALELLKKSTPQRSGRLRIHRVSKLNAEGRLALQSGTLESGRILLNDPETAKEFLAVWEMGA